MILNDIQQLLEGRLSSAAKAIAKHPKLALAGAAAALPTAMYLNYKFNPKYNNATVGDIDELNERLSRIEKKL